MLSMLPSRALFPLWLQKVSLNDLLTVKMMSQNCLFALRKCVLHAQITDIFFYHILLVTSQPVQSLPNYAIDTQTVLESH